MSGQHHANASPTRLAAIDVGTNTIRLIVAEVRPDGSYRLLDDERENARLGAGLHATGELNAAAMDRAAAAITQMRGIAEGYGVERLRVVGTSAVREARNQAEFLALVRTRAGVELDVIDAHEEGRLAFLSVQHAFDLRSMNAAIVDIGGGSTEIVLSAGGVVDEIRSLPLGAVRLTEMFDLAEAPSDRQIKALRAHILAQLKRDVPRPEMPLAMMIGTGGTFTALAAMAIATRAGGRPSGESPSVRGFELKRSDVRHVLDVVAGMPLKARMKLPGLSPERAEIIVAGLAIVERVMKRLDVNTLRVHDRGIRDGLLLDMIRAMHPPHANAAGAGADPMAGVRAFAQACRYEEAHSEHVAKLAVEVFDQLAVQIDDDAPWRDARSRLLLEAAGVLHDVGYSINYERHHKHSYHLIIHSDLPGFTHDEIEVIANVARYHRRAEPKKSHANFRDLSDVKKDLVRKLSGILRIVDGLDRAHSQSVRGVRVQVRKGTAWFLVQADAEPTVDLWGAARKSELFHGSFGLEPRIEWLGSAGESTHDHEAPSNESSSAKHPVAGDGQ